MKTTNVHKLVPKNKFIVENLSITLEQRAEFDRHYDACKVYELTMRMNDDKYMHRLVQQAGTDLVNEVCEHEFIHAIRVYIRAMIGNTLLTLPKDFM